jgi:predicted RNase H-like HicB family nuclease
LTIGNEPIGGYIVLTGFVEEEGNQFVSYCRELGTSSCGDTVAEALGNLGDAIEVHLNALVETGELERVFRERNIRIDLAPSALDSVFINVPPGKIFTTYPRYVPLGGTPSVSAV